ncbi:MAG: HAD family hydrolase [Chloroflexi bacterium]|nr:HAD family hydrolase [Chloroflexota bacterium]
MPLDIHRIRGICFDVDGTLSDTDDRLVAQIESRLVPFRRLLFGRSPRSLARRLIMGIETPGNYLMGIPDLLHLDEPLSRLVSMLSRSRIGRRAEGFWLVPGVVEMLAVLMLRFPLAVVSARDESTTRVFLEQFGLQKYFSMVVTAHTCTHTKPYPDPVLRAAQGLGIAPEECLMVGDTTVDMLAGRRAGAQTVGVLCGFGEEPELRRAGAHLILPTTAQLHQVFVEKIPS